MSGNHIMFHVQSVKFGHKLTMVVLAIFKAGRSRHLNALEWMSEASSSIYLGLLPMQSETHPSQQ